jgi:hypothetical protein
VITPQELRRAALCAATCGEERLDARLRQEADAMEANELELTIPFNLSRELHRQVRLMVANGGSTADAVIRLREGTGRSLRACLRYVMSMKREMEHGSDDDALA